MNSALTAFLAAVLLVELLAVWSMEPLGYYFGILTKPRLVTGQI